MRNIAEGIVENGEVASFFFGGNQDFEFKFREGLLERTLPSLI